MQRHDDDGSGHDDGRLREEFQQLRTETRGSARVPDFTAMLATARADAATQPEIAAARRRSVAWYSGWASAGVAAAVAGLLLTGGPSDADREFERLVASYTAGVSSGAWQSPTSGLMNVPGMTLTRSVPSLGSAIRGLDPSQLPNVPDPDARDL